MRVALVNPHWDFARSIYFGCRSPHLPLELGYCKALLEAAGHDVLMLDGHLNETDNAALAAAVADFAPGMTVVTTAPSYLFWRCAPPELRVPRDFLQHLGTRGGRTVAVGPHGSVTPDTTLRKLGADVVVRGE
ncbi:MAG: cobalamin-dependent protein, partial [Caulobacteraceae bacterium]|nr:cobalamin-dependent protein [Caulobacter sp.]